MIDEYTPCMLHEHKGAAFSITYTDFDDHSQYLENHGGQGGGHSWAALVQAVMQLRGIILPEVQFDPEGDMFSAVSSDRNSLLKIAVLIREISGDRNLMNAAISKAKEEDYFE